jgi:glycosyltransferase involved in cell wall biosynthesis
MPLVSIVMPVWNGADYLEAAVFSVLQQTISDFELIIVDDASTDASFQIISRLEETDSRIKSISNPTNRKLPETLNIGFEIAKGDWFTWVSHDNLLEVDFLEILLSNAYDFRAEFIYSDYKVINKLNQEIKLAKMRLPDYLYSGNCIGASFLYRNYIHTQLNGYDSSKFLYEDFDFWVRTFKTGFRMIYVEESPYRYRVHKDQLSIKKKLPLSFVKYRWELINTEKNIGSVETTRSRISILGVAYRCHYVGIFLKYLVLSFLQHPISLFRLTIAKVFK